MLIKIFVFFNLDIYINSNTEFILFALNFLLNLILKF